MDIVLPCPIKGRVLIISLSLCISWEIMWNLGQNVSPDTEQICFSAWSQNAGLFSKRLVLVLVCVTVPLALSFSANIDNNTFKCIWRIRSPTIEGVFVITCLGHTVANLANPFCPVPVLLFPAWTPVSPDFSQISIKSAWFPWDFSCVIQTLRLNSMIDVHWYSTTFVHAEFRCLSCGAFEAH